MWISEKHIYDQPQNSSSRIESKSKTVYCIINLLTLGLDQEKTSIYSNRPVDPRMKNVRVAIDSGLSKGYLETC